MASGTGDQLRIVLARRDGRWVGRPEPGRNITIDTVPAEPGVGDPPWLAATLIALLDSASSLEPSRGSPGERACRPTDLGYRRPPQGAVVGRAVCGTGIAGPALTELAEVDNPAAEAVLYARVYDDAETRSAKGHWTSARPMRGGWPSTGAAVRGSDQNG